LTQLPEHFLTKIQFQASSQQTLYLS